jgi:acyl-CoA thioester hydrolase
MVEIRDQSPQLRPGSTLDRLQQGESGYWFEYPVITYPHHTDYAGVAWHGTYIAWMEEARVACLKSIGIDFADLVALGCDLPVVEMSIRYHQAVRMGDSVLVRTRMTDMEGVRINWDYQIQAADRPELFVTARVTLVGVDREKGKIMRQLPAAVKNALVKLAQ